MNKPMARALRRHHVERLVKKRRRHFGRQLSPQESSKVVNTPTPCSCWMCGNPRKYFKQKTYQEQKQDGYFSSSLECAAACGL
ncbi:hypothetical protein [Chromobacterium haemolyticum]|uniref:hypothetical protein n=1 Tax=Chromobacterium haemolyticum TaxID=394935 RepID=UPI0013190B76|nr:hypothetical protein [Chromobacterium haemolyticum]BBH11723.1 hypothetical protein CH06BL_09710 [Chromobacterium haemolyticum]